MNPLKANQCCAGELTVSEGFVDPIGFYDPTPLLSWKLPVEDNTVSQSAYRIVTASQPGLLFSNPDLWDTGKVESDQSVWISYAGKPLQSRQKVYWAVMFWNQDGKASDWSQTAHFELGLLENTDWKARWVRMQLDKNSGSEPNIKIIKAVYGVIENPSKQVDLTKKLQDRIQSGSYTFDVSNEFAGSDPAKQIVKSMILEYELDEVMIRKTLTENTSFDLSTGEIISRETFVPQYLRKEFPVDAPVRSARLYVTAKGLYEVYLNGQRIGQDYMAPGWTPYKKRIETLTYDVTSQLCEGKNAVGAILGEGWYAGKLMSKTPVYPQVIPALLLQLEIIHHDGTTQTIITDQGWKATNDGPIRFSGIYYGEIYDARKEMPGWNTAGYNDSSWTGVHAEPVINDISLVPKRHYPVRVTQTLKTQKITQPVSGKYVFDLGQNMVGWPQLKIPVQEGETITVRVAEMLEKDGTLYTQNYRNAKSTDAYTAARSGTITWHPTFTFHGYRYVEISGFPEGAEPKTDWVTGMVLHSDFKQIGRFTSSHTKLNQLQSNITWGQRGNYLDIPTDCPQRDERLGWTGDAQVFCSTSLFNYDVHAFWASWLQSVRQEQNSEGLIPDVVPDILNSFGSPGWGDVAVTSPWNVYIRTGNREILEDNYDMMRRWTEAYARQADNFIVNRKGYGDWLQPFPKSNGHRADTPMDIIATAYFGHCAAIMEKTARILDKPEDVQRYEQIFKNVRHAFSEKFFDQNGKLTAEIPTQTAYLLGLGFDLLEPDLRKGAIQNLLTLIAEANGHLRTGFLGTPLITSVLDRCGHTDIAYQVLLKETYPSWFYSINQGATTMWERWNSYSHKEGFGNAGMNSFNHYAYGAIGQWMYERIAGLAPDPAHPGYKHFFIQPAPGGPLKYASSELKTPYGIAKSGWEITPEGSLLIKATVPPNTTATVIIPSIGTDKPVVTLAECEIKLTQDKGRYTYKVKPGNHVFKVN